MHKGKSTWNIWKNSLRQNMGGSRPIMSLRLTPETSIQLKKTRSSGVYFSLCTWLMNSFLATSHTSVVGLHVLEALWNYIGCFSLFLILNMVDQQKGDFESYVKDRYIKVNKKLNCYQTKHLAWPLKYNLTSPCVCSNISSLQTIIKHLLCE